MSITFDPIFAEGEKLSRSQVAREIMKRLPRDQLRLMTKVLQENYDVQPETATTGGPDRGHWSVDWIPEKGIGPIGGRSEMLATGKMQQVLERMLEGVDEKYLTREFAEHGDIRPLLAEAYNNEDFSEQEKAIAITMIPSMTDVITAQVEAVWPDEQLSDEDKATKDAMINAWRGGEVKSLNVEPQTTIDPRTGETRISAAEGSIAEGGFIPDVSEDGTVSSRRFISESDWRRMLRQGSDDLDSLLMQDELMRQGTGESYTDQTGAEVAIQNLGVQYDDSILKPDNRGGIEQTAPGVYQQDFSIRNVRDEQHWYGVSEVLNKPYELTKEEAVEMHRKMKAAGIFDIAGGEPLVPGDVSDPAFTRAWKYLVTKSMSENKSMMSILEEQTSAYQQAINAQLATQLTDPARVRLNANAMARSAIGRHLSEEEQAELTKFVHELERKNARISAGLEETMDPDTEYSDVDPISEGTLYDVDAQIDQWFENNIGHETGARDMAESYEMFTGMLGGPGRGVS